MESVVSSDTLLKVVMYVVLIAVVSILVFTRPGGLGGGDHE